MACRLTYTVVCTNFQHLSAAFDTQFPICNFTFIESEMFLCPWIFYLVVNNRKYSNEIHTYA